MKKIKKSTNHKTKFKAGKVLGRFRATLKKVRNSTNWEGSEIKQVTEDQQDLPMFWEDSKRLMKDSFIPSERNDHRPLVLRPRSLATYVLIALIFKLSVAGFLFATYPSEAELSEIISSNMLSLMNESRVEEGVAPLEYNDTLATFAKLKGEDMLARNYFAHDTPDGKRPWEWINRGEYDYVYAGENLAMDFVTAEVVHAAFLKSPSHRRNILNPKYKEAGIAVLRGEIEGHETTLLVEFFGTQRKDLDSLVLNDQPTVTQPEAPTPTEPVPSDIAGAETGNQPTKPVVINTKPEPEKPVVKETTKEPTTTPVVAVNSTAPRTVVEDPTSPTPGPINEGVIVVATTQQTSKTLVDEVVEYSNIFFIAFLLFVGLSLLLNIVVKVRVQHAPLIFQSLVVIALLASFMLVNFHFIESVAPQMLIL